MKFEPLAIPDIILITPKRFGDDRGYFSETFRAEALEAAGITESFVQDNHAYSADPGVLRGLHFQRPPTAQGKLVRCTRGAIYDVAVDIRSDSSTYGHYVGVELSAETGTQLFVPAGFAHGYLTLTANCDVQYKVTAYYSPNDEGGIAWDDPGLGIDWPLKGLAPLLSNKDTKLPILADLGTIF